MFNYDSNNTRGSIYIKKYTFIFGFIICFFVLSEFFSPFQIVDSLHIKHFLILASIFIFGAGRFVSGEYYIKKEEKLVYCTIGILVLISLLFQIIHGSFKIYTFVEAYYWITPVLYVSVAFDYIDKEDIDNIFTAVLFIGLFSFVSTRIINGTFTISNIREMFSLQALFVDSVSAVGESSIASSFVVVFIYFVYRKYKWRSLISAFAVFLGYKRFAVLYMLVVLVVAWLIPRKTKVKPLLIKVLTIIFTLLPFTIYYICSDSFASWFYQTFGMDFDTFTMTRFQMINIVVDANITNYGLGTITNYMEERGVSGQLNLHNDIFRIYMECTIIGSFIFPRNFFKMVEDNYFSILTILYIFCELFFDHLLGSGTITVWVLTYMAIFAYNRDEEHISACENFDV